MIKLACVLTTECNLKCLHCLRDNGTPSRLPMEIIKKAVVSSKKFDLELVHFTGGEPFLYPDISELFEFLSSSNIQATFSSNGLLFENKSQIINKYKKIIKFINISLDGCTAEMHDAVRGRGSFKAVLDSFEFSRKNKLSFGVTCCLNKHNAAYLQDMIRFAKKQGARHINFSTVLPCSNAEENELILSENDRQKAFIELRRLFNICAMDFFKLFYVPVYFCEALFASSNIVMCANQSMRTITIDVDGSLHFCCFLTVYNVRKEVEKRLRIADLSQISFEDGVKLFAETMHSFLSERIDDYLKDNANKQGLNFNSCFYCSRKLGITSS